MKTNFLKFSFICSAVFALALTSCSNDDDVSNPADLCSNGILDAGEEGVDCGGTCSNSCPDAATNLTGELTEDRTLDPSLDYVLTNSFSVASGVTLTIPAGTKITANVQTGTETNTYIVVQKGGKIDVQGTEANPVIMTSTNATPGDWGGLVILGDATTTKGVDATAEVGDFKYGGTNDTDNSGSIQYLIINYAGASINADSQYNGLTLYAVGSGTTVENVAMLNGTDDGVEFFGGTVSATNMYMENNEDDSIDWTEGWNGTLTNGYIVHTIEDFSTVMEGDGDNNNPKFVNITAISTVGGTALQFKKESGGTITGLSLSGYDTSLDFPQDGSLSNVQIDGADANPSLTYIASPTVDVALFAWVNSSIAIENSVLSGTVSSDMTLDANVPYFLENALSVESGVTLTIPAGTMITAKVEAGTETNTYIVVQKGGKIDIQGTEANPVVMTSANQTPGDWGGLVILGDATTTKGVDATAEVGDFKYGGSNDADDSGSISYLVINYAGASINADSQYNGLTLYAVGSGTTIANVAMLNGTDDGVEFFGGTVSATNMYMENNEDDAIDWTEGWNGTLTNGYISHTIEGFSTVMEGDGDNNNPKFVNITAVSTVGGTALQFKKESGGIITGLSLIGYTTILDFPQGGAFANVQIEGADADPSLSYDDAATVDVATFAWAK